MVRTADPTWLVDLLISNRLISVEVYSEHGIHHMHGKMNAGDIPCLCDFGHVKILNCRFGEMVDIRFAFDDFGPLVDVTTVVRYPD